MPLLAKVKIPHRSGRPEDTVMNSFAFDLTPGIANANAVLIVAAVKDFYDGVTGGGAKLHSLLSPELGSDTIAPRVDLYDLTGHLDGSAHGAPVFGSDMTWTGFPGAGFAHPGEVAICASFHSAYGADVEFAVGGGRPRGRDRGRVFIGPLHGNTAAMDTNGTARVITSAQTTVIQAMTRLANAGVAWSVWSRSSASLKPVVGGFVDDAFDTQRRRGTRPTARQTFAI